MLEIPQLFLHTGSPLFIHYSFLPSYPSVFLPFKMASPFSYLLSSSSFLSFCHFNSERGTIYTFYHFSISLLGLTPLSQGALAVLKQFLESNLVRTFHNSEHVVLTSCSNVTLWSNLIFSRNTWATNLPISVASWKHTGAGHWFIPSKEYEAWRDLNGIETLELLCC